MALRDLLNEEENKKKEESIKKTSGLQSLIEKASALPEQKEVETVTRGVYPTTKTFPYQQKENTTKKKNFEELFTPSKNISVQESPYDQIQSDALNEYNSLTYLWLE